MMVKRFQNVERLFCILAIIFGLSTVFILPPLAVPDEHNHFLRIYDIAINHHFVSQGNAILPTDVAAIEYYKKHGMALDAIKDGSFSNFLLTKLRYSQRDSGIFFNTALYSPVNYFPQVVGFMLAKAFYPSVYIYMYMGRLINLLVFILLIYIAIRMTPLAKWFFLYFALFPTVLQEASSLAADGFNIGLSFITIAFAFRLIFSDELINRKHILFMLSLAFVLGFLKPVAIVILGMFFLIPRNKYGNFAVIKKWGLNFCIIGIAIFGYLIWRHYIIKYNLEVNYLKITHQAFNTYLSSKDALSSIINHPLGFIKVLFQTIKQQYLYYFTSLYGTFGAFLINLPVRPLTAGYIGILFVSLIGYDQNVIKNITIFQRLFSLALFISYIGMVFLLLYIAWTPINSQVIEGLQGRYFAGALPLIGLPLISSCFYNKSIVIIIQIIIIGVIIFNLTYMLNLIFDFYY